jgi:hypothetical protein
MAFLDVQSAFEKTLSALDCGEVPSSRVLCDIMKNDNPTFSTINHIYRIYRKRNMLKYVV